MNFPSQIFFNDTALLVQSSYIKEKLFVAASILYGCGYLFLLWKGAQNNAVAVVSNLLIRQQLIDSLVLQVAGVTGKASNPPHLKWLKKTLPFLAEKTFFVEYVLI